MTPAPPFPVTVTGPATELPWKSWPMRACEARLAWIPTPAFCDTVLFVIDVLSVEPKDVLDAPKGKQVDAPADAPKVVESGDKVTGIDFSAAPKKAPTKLQVIPLVEGDGPAAKAGRLVTFNYYGAVWGSKKPFDSSFSRCAPVPFGVGVKGLIPAWDKVIPGLKQGSRVLIIAPPGDAYGAQAQSGIPANSTLTFVVDVLGVDS